MPHQHIAGTAAPRPTPEVQRQLRSLLRELAEDIDLRDDEPRPTVIDLRDAVDSAISSLRY